MFESLGSLSEYLKDGGSTAGLRAEQAMCVGRTSSPLHGLNGFKKQASIPAG
jgi:hypothetical protein